MTERRFLGFYDYTVVLTYCGMLFAFFGIFKVLDQEFLQASFCLLLAGTCDMFDGKVAQTKNRTDQEKRFGIQIDSLSDLISFGVFPAIFVYKISEQNVYVGIISAIYTLCALIRLSFFNVMEEERQEQTTECRKTFTGIPVTTIALVLPLIYVFFKFGVFAKTTPFAITLFVLAIGFLTPLNLRKPGNFGKFILILVGLTEVIALCFSALI